MAYDSKQCSDHMQTGIGFPKGTLNPVLHTISGGLGSSGNTKSGSSQSDKRGKQGG